MAFLGALAYAVPTALGLIMNRPFSMFFQREDVRVLSTILSHIVWIALIVTVIKMLDKRLTLRFVKKWRLFLLFIPAFSIVVLVMLMAYAAETHVTGIMRFLPIVISAGLLIMNLGALYVFDQMARQAEQTLLLQAKKDVEHLQVRHQEELQKLYQDIKTFKHDYKNHVYVMHGLIEMEKIAELSQHLQDVSDHLDSLTEFLDTGNAVIDALLSVNIGFAKANDIKVVVEADLTQMTLIKNEHLCILIGNLFCNALEACLCIADPSDRYIRLRFAVQKNNLYLHVENSTAGIQNKIGGRGYSTKKSPEAHGLGLTSVDSIVAQYAGFSERSYAGNVFVTSIILPMRQVSV
jgi:sensor histidine kinase regulating citrate/malate metabolism